MPESKSNLPQDQLLALIALELGDHSAVGAVPTVEEIQQWRSNTLPNSRADEVLSHLANDNDCMRILRQLEELEQIEQEVPSVAQLRAQSSHTRESDEQNQTSLLVRIQEWLGIGVGPTMAGGVGIALVALLVLPMMTAQPIHTTDLLQQSYEQWTSQVPGSFEPLLLNSKSQLEYSPEISQVRQGALAAVTGQGWNELPSWRDWASGLETEALVNCGGSDACEDKTIFYQTLGQWMLAVFHDCEQSGESLDDFSATASKLESESYLQSTAIGNAIAAASKGSNAELCRLSAEMLGL